LTEAKSGRGAGGAEFRAARPDEYPAVLALWGVVWSEGPYFRSYLEGDPWQRVPYCQVAVADERVVSSVVICRRPMRLDGRELTFGGIGNVATHPDYRRRGYSGELLARCVRIMEEERFDFSLLGTGLTSHYARHGWFPVALPHPRRTFAPDEPLPDADPDIQPLTSAQWIEEAPPVYAAYNSRLPLSFDRSPAYWGGWLRIRSEGWPPDRSFLLGLRRDGLLEGYVYGDMANEPGGIARVLEVAAVRPEQISRLLDAAFRVAREGGAGSVTLRVPHGHGLPGDPPPPDRRAGIMMRGFRSDAEEMRRIETLYADGRAIWWGPDDY
jgi:GNAT superfamily N-acetyltransferase